MKCQSTRQAPQFRIDPPQASINSYLQLMTNGSNYPGIWQAADHVADINAVYSNDIYSSLCTYGVEMARASIVREMRAVFKAYSISVDERHLGLIADYMVSISFRVAVKLLTATRCRRSMVVTSRSIAEEYPPTARRSLRPPLKRLHHSYPMQRYMGTLTT